MASLKVLVSLGESESFWWVGACTEEEPDGVRFLVGVVGGLGEKEDLDLVVENMPSCD